MKEGLSALVDDALDEESAVALFHKLRSDSEALRAWHTYHLIGDSIRGDAVMQVDLVEKVMARLEVEPAILAPRPRPTGVKSRLRWALPLAASVMGVGAVAWVAQSLNRQAVPAETLARLVPPPSASISTTPAAASLASAEVARPPDSGRAVPVQASFVREYLVAHQAYSPGARMGGMAQYVRTVSESRDEPAK